MEYIDYQGLGLFKGAFESETYATDLKQYMNRLGKGLKSLPSAYRYGIPVSEDVGSYVNFKQQISLPHPAPGVLPLINTFWDHWYQEYIRHYPTVHTAEIHKAKSAVLERVVSPFFEENICPTLGLGSMDRVFTVFMCVASKEYVLFNFKYLEHSIELCAGDVLIVPPGFYHTHDISYRENDDAVMLTFPVDYIGE